MCTWPLFWSLLSTVTCGPSEVLSLTSYSGVSPTTSAGFSHQRWAGIVAPEASLRAAKIMILIRRQWWDCDRVGELWVSDVVSCLYRFSHRKREERLFWLLAVPAGSTAALFPRCIACGTVARGMTPIMTWVALGSGEKTTTMAC